MRRREQRKGIDGKGEKEGIERKDGTGGEGAP
jgi:hypothetical protein